MTTALLYTGGREWKRQDLIEQRFTLLPPRTVIVHGDCPDGGDQIAHFVAEKLGHVPVPFPYFPNRRGLSGGPERNAAMVRTMAAYRDHGWTVWVLGTPTAASKGTWSCLHMAKDAGIRGRVVFEDGRVSDW